MVHHLEGTHRARSVIVVVLAAVMVAGLLGTPRAAFADPVPADTTPTTIPESTVPGPTDATGSSSTTVLGGVTTTTVAKPPVTSGPGGFGGPRIDPNAPPEPPIPDPTPKVRVLLSQLRLQDRQKGLDVTLVALAGVQRLEDAAAARVTAAEAAVASAQGLVRASERRLRTDALAMYVNPGQTGLEKLVDSGGNEGHTRSLLLDVTIEHEKQVRLDALAFVVRRKNELSQRQNDLVAAQGRTAAEQQVVDHASEARDYRRRELNVSLQLSPDWSLPIMGTSAFTAAELGDWFRLNGAKSRAQASTSFLAAAYVDEGNDEHVRGDMAFAQSLLETGTFTNDDTIRLNNFAGVGHCDSCATGFAFATPQLGVRAQMQLLHDYAQVGAVLRHPIVDRRLHGPSGCCQTWRELTHTWATDGNYGAKIMDQYFGMLMWLVRERGLSPMVS